MSASKLFTLLLILICGGISYGQRDSTRIYIGFSPQYVAVQAMRVDIEFLKFLSPDISRSLHISPYLYNGITTAFERSNPDFSREVFENQVKGVGLESSILKGIHNHHAGLTVFGQYGLGFHHIHYYFEERYWVEETDMEGFTYVVLQDHNVHETVNRFDIFILASLRKRMFYLDGPSITLFAGPVLRLARIHSTGVPREHRGILQHGSSGVMIKAGATFELGTGRSRLPH